MNKKKKDIDLMDLRSPNALHLPDYLFKIYCNANDSIFATDSYTLKVKDSNALYERMCQFMEDRKMPITIDFDMHPEGTPIYMGDGRYNWRKDANVFAFFHELGHYITAKPAMRKCPNYGLGDDYMGGKAEIFRVYSPRYPDMLRHDKRASAMEFLLLLALAGNRPKWGYIVKRAMYEEGYVNFNNRSQKAWDRRYMEEAYAKHKHIVNSLRYTSTFVVAPTAFFEILDAKGKVAKSVDGFK